MKKILSMKIGVFFKREKSQRRRSFCTNKQRLDFNTHYNTSNIHIK